MTVVQLIARHEGNRLFPYCDRCGEDVTVGLTGWVCGCVAASHRPGNITIGVGRNLSGVGISGDEIAALLDNDLQTARKTCSRFVWWGQLNDARQAALLDLCFNLGETRFIKFADMLAACAAGSWADAAASLLDSLAAEQEHKRIAELADMLKTGEWPA